MTVKDDYNPETEQYTLTISQRTPATPDQAEKQPLHIPFAIELYDNEGKVIPLQKGGHPGEFGAERHPGGTDLCL
ncbi:DUF3458 domain-containing protein [Escherichia coli]|uniref:DUF3458 domain-containing protein n=1 Tax=Escherichia coli TaxID=562 RepID=UPI0004565D29|nr:DUF3458 domain-containing protein [Escherichia coli]AHM55315.1 hypothetical protein CF60_31370 [Escherichia coli]